MNQRSYFNKSNHEYGMTELMKKLNLKSLFILTMYIFLNIYLI